MKKLFLIFGFMFAFVLGTNTVNAQENNDELKTQLLLIAYDKIKEDHTDVFFREFKILDNKLYWSIRADNSYTYMFVLNTKEYKGLNSKILDFKLFKEDNILSNLIRAYQNKHNNNSIAAN